MECWISGWTAPKQGVVDVVREAWMCESGKDECVRVSEGPETVYWWGTEFGRCSEEWVLTIFQGKLQQATDLRTMGRWVWTLSY